MYSVHNACATQQAKLLQNLFELSLSFRVALSVWKKLCTRNIIFHITVDTIKSYF